MVPRRVPRSKMNGPVFPSVLLLLSIGTFFQSGNSVRFDYYWRDYTGEIPEDAVPGGLDKNRQTTYIGQVVYLTGKFGGIFPVPIYKGNKVVKAEWGGVHALDHFIRILCSPNPGNFEWLTANSTNIQLVSIGKHLVPAGVEHGAETNVGRIQFQGELVIGKVLGGVPNGAVMFFAYYDETKMSPTYQVLTYNDNFDTSKIKLH